MYGIDVSHWQGIIDWSKIRKAGYPFAILKCTQGYEMKDARFERNKAQARQWGILLGYYHFANGLNATREADWFVKNVGWIEKGEFLVLDWEIQHSQPVAWCKEFLDAVYQKTGVKPMLYTNEYRVKSLNWSPVVKSDYGLWVAKYASQKIYVPYYLQRKPESGKWPFWAIWQFSSRGKVPGISGNVDINYTKMDLETLKKYGKNT